MVVLYRVLKFFAVVLGLPLSVLVMMAALSMFTDNGWVQFGGALALVFITPIVVAAKLLPKEPEAGRGIPTDVAAVMWLASAALAIGPLHPLVSPLLNVEGEQLASRGHSQLGAWTSALAGPQAEGEEESILNPTESEIVDAGVDAPEAEDANVEEDSAVDAEPPPEPADEDLPPSELFSRWSPSVVTISTGQGGGTGFVIDHDGTIATNQHVIREAPRVGVKFVDGTWASEVEVLMENEDLDLALLRVTTTARLHPVLLSNSDAIQVGEHVISIGNPLGLEHTLTDGLVSARRVHQGRPMIQMSAPVSPGNSGGPVFNRRGEVIGVTTLVVGMGFAQNLNLAIPINVLKEQLEQEYPDRRSAGGGPIDGTGTW
ncbi:MAG: serine protease Do [Polyangiales bacterium]|jgi:serine protease Do